MPDKRTKWIKSGDKVDVKMTPPKAPLHKSPIWNRRLPIRSLFVGPYSHEFGHELFSFQGYARNQSKILSEDGVPYEKVIVSCRDDMRFLYEDFATDFLTTEEAELMEFSKDTREGSDLITHISESFCRSAVKSGTGIFRHDQLFIEYGSPAPFTPKTSKFPAPSLIKSKWSASSGFFPHDIIVHARRKKGKMSINLQDEDYDVFFKDLSPDYRIGFIGSKSQAYCPAGADDLRGIPLSKLADILSSCRLVVGQSSGPVHFASLCKAPHLTWGGYRFRTYIRYAHHWNPFSTLCYLFESSDSAYLKSRSRKARLPKDILSSSHFNIIGDKNYRHPPINEVILRTKEILNSKKLDEYNEKRMLCHPAKLRGKI
jgi:hypothetical protein